MQSLQDIQSLIDDNRITEARQVLKQILRTDPSADAWYMTALIVNDEQQKIKCLRNALKLDEFHSPANRLLYKIEGGVPQAELEKRKQREEALKNRELKPLEKIDRELKKDRWQRHAERQKQRTRIGCAFIFVLMASCSMFSFSAIGLLPGFIGMVTGLLGGSAPVYEISGTPIEVINDAILVMTPAQSNKASSQNVDIMDHGYLHEYVFSARVGKTYAIYVQFMSLNANAVSRHVVILDAQGQDKTFLCERETILDGDNGVTYVCTVDSSGDWVVRILGINGESVGAYFIGVEALAY